MIYEFNTSDFEIKYIESENCEPFFCENHCHAQFEIISVLKGDITVVLEGIYLRVRERQSIIIPPLCYHSIMLNEIGSYRRITCLFDPSAIPFVLRDEFEKKGTDAAIFTFSHADRLKEICQSSYKSFYEPLAESLMTQLFYDAVRSKKGPTEDTADDFLQKAVAYIDKHLNEKILLDDLARHTSRSKSSFCHLFEKKMNISPKQYILQKKLALASKLIGEGTSPTLAAMQIGYDNYSNFYRLYQKHFGSSPTKKDSNAK